MIDVQAQSTYQQVGCLQRLRGHPVSAQNLPEGPVNGFRLRSFKDEKCHSSITKKHRPRHGLRVNLRGGARVVDIYVEPDSVFVWIGYA